MNQETLFISDLHLCKERPEVTRRFLDFLADRAILAEQLYILGDLFDSWIGDDDDSPFNRQIIEALKKTTAAGTRIFFLGGNRDFLIGERFSDATGVELLEDYTVIDLYDSPTLLMHGDLLCSDDIEYLTYREMSHDTEWIKSKLKLPLFMRRAFVRWIKIRSFLSKKNKNNEIMDVNPETVVETMKEYGVMRLIHGHTHRVATHEFSIDNQPAHRFVLEEWDNGGSILCWTAKGHSFEPLPDTL